MNDSIQRALSRSLAAIAAVGLATLLGAGDAHAQPCPGMSAVGVVHVAYNAGIPSTVSCAPGTPVGAAIMCAHAQMFPTTAMNVLIAYWANTAARTMDAAGGCAFMCNTGDCHVGNNGLPVELLVFGLE